MRRSRQAEHHDREHDEEDEVPLHHRRPFGSGLKRKRVEFVPAQQADSGIATVRGGTDGVLAGDLYAQIVMGDRGVLKGNGTEKTTAKDAMSLSEASASKSKTETDNSTEPPICPICSLPVTSTPRQHEASLAHQVSLTHSHPPSALDRSRMGLRTLASRGWDPDARCGLGMEGEGVRFPIKTAAKDNNLGIGATMPEMKEGQRGKNGDGEEKKLSAKELRVEREREKRRGEMLQREIYGSVDVEKYLRGDGTGDS